MSDIRRWMTSPILLGDEFGDASWDNWRVLLAGFNGQALSNPEARVFHDLTGRRPPKTALDELWLVVGRRGGKSNVSALLAVISAVTFEARDRLSAGERATVMVIAEDRKQARSVYRYISGLLHLSPTLEAMIDNELKEYIELDNRVVIEVHTASFRRVRGYTLLAVIMDEIAFWMDEGANPADEVVSALRPGLGTLQGRLIALSSPYARRGVLWEMHREHYGKDGPILVAKAPTRTMNPTFPQETIDKALALDRSRACAEYLAEFRTDVETFVPREAVEACIEPRCRELPHVLTHQYFAFVDPSGGRSDSMTLAIAHVENDVRILDVVRERKAPFDPSTVVDEFTELLSRFHLNRVTGDAYAGQWPPEQFRKKGIYYQPSKLSRSELYSALLPVINSGQARLLDNERLVNQLIALERRTSRAGRDSIDHPPGGHDDIANAVAGALVGITALLPMDWRVL